MLSLGVVAIDSPASSFALTSPFPSTIDPRLSKFGLYASRSLKLNDRTELNPWWVATSNLTLGYGNRLRANVVASGNVNLRRPVVWGDLMYGGELVSQGVVAQSIQGTVTKSALSEFAGLNFSLVPPASPGSVGTSIEPDKSGSLAPGEYGSVAVKSRATLRLEGGRYVFESFQMEPDAKVEVKFNGAPLEIWVASSLFFKRNVNFVLDGGDAGDILWMYTGSGEVIYDGMIGYNPVVKAGAGVPGTLIAPNASVSLASNARIWGALWAKDIEIHQDNAFCEFVPYDGNPSTTDADADGLENLEELKIGADYLDPDTDDDGFNDGLEYWGRDPGRLLGAVNSIGSQAPSWGVYLDPSRTEFFNPLRRDAFLRLLWQPDDELASGSVSSYMADPAVLAQYRKEFAKPDNFSKVADSSIARVRTNTWSLHIDAGSVTENLPVGFSAQGGSRITSNSPAASGKFFFDADGNKDADVGELFSVTGDIVAALPVESFPDIFVHGYGVFRKSDDAGLSAAHNGFSSVAHGFFYAEHNGGIAPYRNATLVLHEFGHSFGLEHPAGQNGLNVINFLHQGVMNYNFSEGEMTCTMAKEGNPGGSWRNTHWCGDPPDKAGLVPDETHDRYGQPYYRNFLDGDFSVYVPWWTNPKGTDNSPMYENAPLAANAKPFHYSHGNMDRVTGFHRGTHSSPLLEDLTFSTGRLCAMDLRNVDERLGAALCKDRNGKVLPEPEVLSPIDWNMDGVINQSFVTLADGTTELWKDYFRKEPAIMQSEPPKNEWMLIGERYPRKYDGSGYARLFAGYPDPTSILKPVAILADGFSLTHSFAIP